ncbi:MAG: nitroreductase family protein [Actinobacteria bacterium]|nr:nitroreductase family protein [Actinomycetota bacterium]
MDTYLAVASKRDERRYAEREVPPELVRRIVDAGRVAGSSKNSQPWLFLVVETPELLERLAGLVYAPENVLGAKLVVVIVTTRGRVGFDHGRAAQNMMLAAWNEGVVSCPNGVKDSDATSALLGLEGEERPANVLSFGYPARPHRPERTAEQWAERANRRPLEEVVRRL